MIDPFLCRVCGHEHGISEPCHDPPAGLRTIVLSDPRDAELSRLRAALASSDARGDALASGLERYKGEADRLRAEVARWERNAKRTHAIFDAAGVPPAAHVACDNPECETHLQHRAHVLVADRDSLRASVSRLERERDEAVAYAEALCCEAEEERDCSHDADAPCGLYMTCASCTCAGWREKHPVHQDVPAPSPGPDASPETPDAPDAEESSDAR